MTVLQVFDVLVSAGTGYVVYVVAGRVIKSRLIAIFCWLLFALGATWWKFSTDVDSYVISVFLLVLGAGFLLVGRRRMIAAAGCHSAAMLFHELAIFTYIPVIALIMLDRQRTIGERFRTGMAYLGGSGSIVGAMYLICYAYADHATFPSLLKWVTSYASDSGFTHSASQFLGSYLTSYIKLFLGGRLSLLRDYFSVTVCLSLLLCCGALVWAVILLRRPEQGDSAARVDGRVLIFLWSWLLGYGIFFACWDPGSAFHKLFVWPAIVLLIGAYAAQRSLARAHAKGLIATAIAIGAWNFAAFIYPHSHASADPVLTLAQTIDKQLPEGATVYYRVLGPDDWYLEYFAPGRFWSRLQTENGRAYIGLTKGPVCFETTALNLIGNNPAIAAAIDPARRWDLVNGKHNIRLECLKEPGLAIRPDSGRRGHYPR